MRFILLIFLSLLIPFFSPAQSLVPTFSKTMMGDPFTNVSTDESQNIYVYGTIDNINGVNQKIARLKPSGKTDPSFKIDIKTGYVGHVTIKAANQIYLGGFFETFDGSVVKGLAKVKSDGSFDQSFSVSPDIEVHAFDFQADGKIIALVAIDNWYDKIIRLNTDGSLDETFQTVNLTLIPFSKILVGSDDQIYFTSRYYVGKLMPDGSLNDSFSNLSFNYDWGVYAMKKTSTGKILIGGAFTRFNGKEVPSIVQLNTDGTVDASFNGPSENLADINAIEECPNGEILIGGTFGDYNSQSARIIRLSPDGQFVRIEAGISNAPAISSIVAISNESLIAGGQIYLRANDPNNVQGVEQLGLIKITNGKIDSSLKSNASFTPFTQSLEVSNNSKVAIASTSMRGTFSNHQSIFSAATIFNGNGGIENPKFKPDNINPKTFTVYNAHQFLFQEDGKILFLNYSASNRFGGIVRFNLDGTIDNSFQSGFGPDGPVASGVGAKITMVKQRGELLYASGERMIRYNLTSTSGIVILNMDGSILRTYAIPSLLSIYNFDFQSDGKIVAIAEFSDAPDKKLIRINVDGTLDDSFAPFELPEPGPFLIDGLDRIYLGSAPYSSPIGPNQSNLIRLTSNGVIDQSFEELTGLDNGISCMGIFPNGNILISGYFTSYQNQSVNGLMMLSENGETLPVAFYDFAPTSTVDRFKIKNGRLYMAGKFINPDYKQTWGLIKYLLNEITIPEAPVSASVSLAAEKTAKIEWKDNSTDELGFTIERASAESPEFIPIDTIDANITSFIDSINYEIKYSYRIKAINEAGGSSYSNTASITWYPQVKFIYDPKYINYDENDFSAIYTWTIQKNSYEQGFVVQRSIGDTDHFVLYDTVPKGQNEIKVFSRPNILYYYRVAAYNTTGMTEYSFTNPLIFSIPSKAPSDLKLSFISPDSIALSWKDNSRDEIGFKLYENNSNNPYANIIQKYDSNTTSVKLKLDTRDIYYWFTVQAYNVLTESEPSNIDSIMIASPPSQLSVYLTTNLNSQKSFHELFWHDESVNELGFIIERMIESHATWTVLDTVGSNVTQYKDPAIFDKKISYRVRAYTVYQETEYTNIFSLSSKEIITGVQKEDAFKIYPNPVRNKLHIDFTQSASPKTLTILNFLGQELSKTSTSNDHVELNLESLTPGNYIVRLEIDGQSSFSKIIKID